MQLSDSDIYEYIYILFQVSCGSSSQWKVRDKGQEASILEEMVVQIKWDHILFFLPFYSGYEPIKMSSHCHPAKCRWEDVPERVEKSEVPESKAMSILTRGPRARECSRCARAG